MTKTILVIDTGSSSMRGILFDLSGNILFSHQIQYAMTVGADDSAVMDAEIFTRYIKEIASLAAKEIEKGHYALMAISLDSQRSSVLAVDKFMHPLDSILMWYDKRCSSICSNFPSDTLKTIYNRCGMRLTPISSAPKMLWMKRNMPEIYNSAYKLIGIHDYLLYTLTGKLVTDASCACRSALMDIQTFDWSAELLSIFEIDQKKLCPIVRSGTIIGPITAAFSAETGLPTVSVISAGGDQQSCLAGQGLLEDGTISINSGSASYLSIPLTTPITDPHAEVNLSAFHGTTPWLLEAANMGSGTLYQWYNRNFYHNGKDTNDTTEINKEVDAQPAGCNGLICHADFAGRGCPDTDPQARGIFANIGLHHTRGAFARAILEGICFDICSCINHIEDLGISVKQIQSTGGLTNLSVFNQILADMSGRRVVVCSNPESTATGAFLIATQALGLPYPDALLKRPCQIYDSKPVTHQIYMEMFSMRSRKEYL